MAITDPVVLPADVLLVPVAELPESVRRQLTFEKGDYAVTRPRSRTASRIVDAGAAALLASFRQPTTIVEAVIRFSRERSLDPETILEEAYPLLERLLSAGFLVAEGAAGAEEILQVHQPGEEVAGFLVLECVQVLEDTELYQVRAGDGTTAALKIERPSAAGRTGDDFAREAAILAHLAGKGAPRLLGQGELDGRRYLAVEWCSGVDAWTAAAELRRGERAGLLALARSILDAYVRLHARGVIHGDVHPRNVLVSPAGEARLIDFGIARWEGSPGGILRPWRGGVAFYFEPEYAAAVLAGGEVPEASAAGEQYAVAALLYYLLAGAQYRDFPLEKEKMLRQIAEEPPLPFAERGAAPWPEVEALLARGLAKSPGERFPSMAAFAEAFAAVAPPPPVTRKAGPSAGEALLTRVLERLRPDGALFREGFPQAPRLSVNYGAAGAACALYRIALAREDAELLSLADLWSVKAVAAGTPDEGFYNPERELSRETLGRVTPYHSPSGPLAVQALVAHALGDLGGQRRAVAAFLETVRQPCDNPDLTLGRSGVLLAAAMLLDALPGEPGETELAKALRELGDGLLAGLWQEIGEQPPVLHAAGEWANLGMAHGWAGYLYASLRWCRSSGTLRPERMEERLAELAGCARSWGRGLRWPWRDARGSDAGTMPGWCNGSAGFVHLWTLAHRELGDPAWLDLAEGAAWNAWEAPDRVASLCCGLAGRAYALLDLWRHAGGEVWLERARDLTGLAAVEAVRGEEAPESLYKGEIGVAALVADLARPDAAAQPFFGDEGWGG